MKDENLSIAFSVVEPPERVFEAIQNVRGWWGEGIEGSARAIGDEFRYRHDDLHDSTQKVVGLVPAERIVWRVTDARLSFIEHTSEWKGTQIQFEIARTGDGSDVRFTHVGLSPASECFEQCNEGWGFYVGESLRALIVTGRGKPDAEAKARRPSR